MIGAVIMLATLAAVVLAAGGLYFALGGAFDMGDWIDGL